MLTLCRSFDFFLRASQPHRQRCVSSVDCTAGGKFLRLHFECPLLENVLLPETHGPASYIFGPCQCVVPFSGQFPCTFPHQCSRSPQLCSTTGHTGCQPALSTRLVHVASSAASTSTSSASLARGSIQVRAIQQKQLSLRTPRGLLVLHAQLPCGASRTVYDLDSSLRLTHTALKNEAGWPNEKAAL